MSLNGTSNYVSVLTNGDQRFWSDLEMERIRRSAGLYFVDQAPIPTRGKAERPGYFICSQAKRLQSIGHAWQVCSGRFGRGMFFGGICLSS